MSKVSNKTEKTIISAQALNFTPMRSVRCPYKYCSIRTWTVRELESCPEYKYSTTCVVRSLIHSINRCKNEKKEREIIFFLRTFLNQYKGLFNYVFKTDEGLFIATKYWAINKHFFELTKWNRIVQREETSIGSIKTALSQLKLDSELEVSPVGIGFTSYPFEAEIILKNKDFITAVRPLFLETLFLTKNVKFYIYPENDKALKKEDNFYYYTTAPILARYKGGLIGMCMPSPIDRRNTQIIQLRLNCDWYSFLIYKIFGALQLSEEEQIRENYLEDYFERSNSSK